MPNIAWVKNVYSLCVDSPLNRVQTYTTQWLSDAVIYNPGVKAHSFTRFLDSFAPQLYTEKLHTSNLLINHFYTVSTPPIIKKMNKK